MALRRAVGLCRLTSRAHWSAARLPAVGDSGEPPSGEDKRRRADLAARRRERGLRPLSEDTQAEPQLDVYGTLRPSRKQVQLNTAIRDSVSVDEILDLVTTRSALLNGVIVPTALSVAAKLIGKREPALWLKSDARFRQLMRSALLMMESGAMEAQGFSNTLYACGQLGVVPPPSWLNVYWDASELKLGDFAPQALSNTMYACSQLGVVPPADWLQRYWDVSASKLGEFIPQDYSNSLYACSLIGIRPPAHWLQRFWHASALNMGEFVPQALSNTLYACSLLGIKPPADWMWRFWHASAFSLGEFKPQELSITMYACGQLDKTPPPDWLLRFWHASALKLGDFIPQDLSNTLYACGRLGVTPPADWLLRFWHASSFKLAGFVPQALANTLLACGDLHVVPPADWLQAFSREFGRALPGTDQQNLANTALALAILGLWELPLWPGLWQRFCLTLSPNISSWSAENRLQARQLYQAYSASVAERPGLLPPPSPELLAAARQSWVHGLDTDKAITSKLHGDVSVCLTRLGYEHANERWCERAERCIDIVIEGAAPVAVEVDGPTHFLQDGRQTGSTMLRNRVLAAHGWRVIVVDYRVWQHELTSEAQREDYMRRLLA